MLTIIELAEYRRKVAVLLNEEENSDLINHLATHPEAGG